MNELVEVDIYLIKRLKAEGKHDIVASLLKAYYNNKTRQMALDWRKILRESRAKEVMVAKKEGVCIVNCCYKHAMKGKNYCKIHRRKPTKDYKKNNLVNLRKYKVERGECLVCENARRGRGAAKGRIVTLCDKHNNLKVSLGYGWKDTINTMMERERKRLNL